MRIALVHDDLVQWGGAERVLVGLSEIFPDAPIYTSVYDKNNKIIKQHFRDKKIITSFLQKIPGWRSLYRALLPFYPIAFEQFDFTGFDMVISQTTRFAKSIITKPETYHICYCHTPPRFLWDFSGQKPFPFLKPYFNYLRKYDQISAKRVDKWVAGSFNAQDRIKKVYQADADVIHPFVDLDKFSNIKTFDGGYLLVVSRLNAYKKIDIVIKAANRLKSPLKIIGEGPSKGELMRIAGPTIDFLGSVDEDTLLLVLSGCKALVVCGEEDFGLTPLEAQALGKPVVAYKKGGALETVADSETGFLFEDQTEGAVIDALSKLDKKGYNQKKCCLQAKKFSKENFMRNFQALVASL